MRTLEGWRWVGRKVLYGKSICSSQCGKQKSSGYKHQKWSGKLKNSWDLHHFAEKQDFFPFFNESK
jgi:hypothetical protein